MKWDYHRYLAEFKVGDERKAAAEGTMSCYKAAQDIALAEVGMVQKQLDAWTAGHGQTDQLRRSGNGSSSSSEDDGQGGRRKKGLKDKIKEKLPGGHKEEQHQQGQYPSSGAT